MAAKRTATMDLNHDNWNEDMPVEEAGTFKCANRDELGRRVLKKAKRRMGGDHESTIPPMNKAFEGLKGLSSSTADSSKPSFNFGVQPPKNDSKSTTVANGVKKGGPSNGIGSIGELEATDMLATSRPEQVPSDDVVRTSAKVQRIESGVPTPSTSTKSGGDRTEYYRQLRSLNEGVLAWIKQHVDKNAYCILSPIFIDYDRHVRELDARYSVKSVAKTVATSTRSVAAAAAVAPVDTTDSVPLDVSGCGDVQESAAAKKINWPTLAMKSTPLVLDRTFGSVEVDSFVATTINEEDAYVPPKSEVQEVKEEDAFYSIRCKLFYKKDSSFAEKGVGMLFLKSTANDKTQLVIRAETNLGNILLNILLTTNLPTARMGKNNVSLICVPNPPLDPKFKTSSASKGGDDDVRTSPEPVTFLVRVKSADDADRLLKKLDECKS